MIQIKLKLVVTPLLIPQSIQSWVVSIQSPASPLMFHVNTCVFQRTLSPHQCSAPRRCVCVVTVCVRGEVTCGKSARPPCWFLLITQRSQPTPGHFLPDLPQESRACWASDHTCWSQTILLPVPDGPTDTSRTTEGESHGFFQTLAVFTSFSLTRRVSLSFISLLTIHPGPAGSAGSACSGSALGTK